MLKITEIPDPQAITNDYFMCPVTILINLFYDKNFISVFISVSKIHVSQWYSFENLK